ncbi:aminoglycoside phosphotransferase family protein [Ottowia oryzae]|uniref:Aminoglycoside phosphotransferase n=1 Tax=Ottowia oryzae TaxID=2109914 RepID=A0A2S0MAM0_9BURK|nr:phosphotransferase [Ottowia oryzae]AVO32932.1 aminoglycoside phosphotransferase [Ottowia oryzae]
MSAAPHALPPSPDAPAPLGAPAAPLWPDADRQAAFARWMAGIADEQGLRPASVRIASADASFRRYLRVDTQGGGSRIVMDAPPAHENCQPFVHVAALMHGAGLNAPEVLAWDQPHGFMLLSDLGSRTMIEAVQPDNSLASRPLYEAALDALLPWQQASRPGELPPYDEALLRRELALFPDWYLEKHRGVPVQGKLRDTLDKTFDLIVARNLPAPSVYVHRDFMPRNLMLPTQQGGPLGVLDFQDAVYGPLTYDIASLMRDAFLSWDEEFVLDITVRYWERARKAGLMDYEDWHNDFGSFWRAVEWMGLQRHLKVAGIFARLTLRDGKPKYLADTPRFIGYIRHTAGRYRELTPLLRLIDEVEGTQAAAGWAFGRVG